MFILDSKRARAWLSDISERYCMMRKACAFSWLHASFARKGRRALLVSVRCALACALLASRYLRLDIFLIFPNFRGLSLCVSQHITAVLLFPK